MSGILKTLVQISFVTGAAFSLFAGPQLRATRRRSCIGV
jgi:hypothetical protein